MYTIHMTTTDAGRLGEAKVLARLAELGWYPFVDISGKCPVDVLAWKDGVTRSFQVKSTSYSPGKNQKYVVQIGSVRPNRTGNVIKKFDSKGFDYLAVYVAPEDKVYFVKSSSITTGRTLTIQQHHGAESPR
jgi:hypothetical protein